MKYTGRTKNFFEVLDIDDHNGQALVENGSEELSIIWFQEEASLKIDHQAYEFSPNDILCLTEFHEVEIQQIKKAKLLRWNRPFYCIVTQDSEVGCRGILFFGASGLPIIHPNDKDLDILAAVWKMLEIEMDSNDDLQEEMLQMMLKRIIILCTRMYKEQSDYVHLDHDEADIIRRYNYLVEKHFKEKHTVEDYAELLFKSPKTLSNLFKKMGSKTPLQFIQDRKLQEARSQLVYTDKSVSEIGYDIGFSDIQSFSRFFKKKEGQSPAEFRKLSA